MPTPKSNIDDELKIAERDKYIAEKNKLDEEAAKAKAEHLRITLDYEEAKEEKDKHFIRKKNSRQILISTFVGLSILGFYINFLIVPAFKTDSINMSLDIAKKNRQLESGNLKLDSANEVLKINKDLLRKKTQRQDTISKLLDSQSHLISQLNSTIDIIRSEYYKLTINTNPQKNISILTRIKTLDSNFKKQKVKLETITAQTKKFKDYRTTVYFNFTLNNRPLNDKKFFIDIRVSDDNNFTPIGMLRFRGFFSSITLQPGNYFLHFHEYRYKLANNRESFPFQIDSLSRKQVINIPLKESSIPENEQYH